MLFFDRFDSRVFFLRPIAVGVCMLAALASSSAALAQSEATKVDPSNWRGPRGATASKTSETTGKTAADSVRPALRVLKGGPAARVADSRRTPIARVSKGAGVLPNDQGQIWREYDIRPYTLRVTTTKRPEHAIVDWILRETGWEAWHSETVAVLSADRGSLRVYHTPKMQELVSEVVDRFVNSKAESHGFSLHVVTVGNPNWRAGAVRVLKPIPVQSQGVQAWLLAKEDAAILRAQLKKRSDYREYTSPQFIVHNGQSAVVSTTRSVRYAKSVIPTPGVLPGYQIETGVLDVGYSLEFNPLLSLDGKMLDAVVKCNIDQLEKMVPVKIDVPGRGATGGRQRIEIPQLTSCKLHERFRWPSGQVLLISRGVVATPGPAGNPLKQAIPLLPKTPDRADALVFIEPKGRVKPAAAGATTAGRRYQGRY